MTLRVNHCTFCQHYRRGRAFPPTCAAFSDGIPDPILWGEADHRYPYPGDHGIRFARRPDVDPARWPHTADVPVAADVDVSASRP